MLDEVADGVWVRQSEWVWTNSIVVRVDDGLVIVDPGINGSELDEIAADVDRLGLPVVAGFATHAHFDHVLWHARFGNAPRYATAVTAAIAEETREQAKADAVENATGVPLELVGLVEPLPQHGSPIPGELFVHDAHARGHAALLLVDRGVLLAGDLLSDILIPLLDSTQTGQLDAFDAAFDLIAPAVERADVVIPGHGFVATGADGAARLAADRAYIAALRRGEDSPDDARLHEHDWLAGPHGGNLAQLRAAGPD